MRMRGGGDGGGREAKDNEKGRRLIDGEKKGNKKEAKEEEKEAEEEEENEDKEREREERGVQNKRGEEG